jgi:hypothetical protein
MPAVTERAICTSAPDPKTGESADAASYVSSNAPKLIDAFDRGVTITAKGSG